MTNYCIKIRAEFIHSCPRLGQIPAPTHRKSYFCRPGPRFGTEVVYQRGSRGCVRDIRALRRKMRTSSCQWQGRSSGESPEAFGRGLGPQPSFRRRGPSEGEGPERGLNSVETEALPGLRQGVGRQPGARHTRAKRRVRTRQTPKGLQKQNPQRHNIFQRRPLEESCYECAAPGIRRTGQRIFVAFYNILIITNLAAYIANLHF